MFFSKLSVLYRTSGLGGISNWRRGCGKAYSWRGGGWRSKVTVESELVEVPTPLLGPSSTASDVLADRSLAGKVMVVTGATSGIGFATARALASRGAEVVLSGRSLPSCRLAKRRILEELPSAKLLSVPMELASLSSVRSGAAFIAHRYKAIDVVILNAGVSGVPWALTEDKIESTFQINHLSQFYLMQLLQDRLVHGSRVVVVSSDIHRLSEVTLSNITEESLNPSSAKTYNPSRAYCNTKLCNVLFGVELHRLWAPYGVTVVSLHPGSFVATGVAMQSLANWVFCTLAKPFTKSVEQAAATPVYCAAAPQVKALGGAYFSNCAPCTASDAATDPDLARVVWTMSQDILQRHMPPVTVIPTHRDTRSHAGPKSPPPSLQHTQNGA